MWWRTWPSISSGSESITVKPFSRYRTPSEVAKLELNLVTDPGVGTADFNAVRLEQVQ